MNVTGVDWRGIDPHDARFLPDRRQRRHNKQTDPRDDEDTVEIHHASDDDASDDDTSDGLDVVGS